VWVVVLCLKKGYKKKKKEVFSPLGWACVVVGCGVCAVFGGLVAVGRLRGVLWCRGLVCVGFLSVCSWVSEKK